MALSREARQFFTRLIYKKSLFAKVVGFEQKTNPITSRNTTNASTITNTNTEGPLPEIVCKIILGCQTTRGIIDVFMYMLSKFDRPRYEALKRCQQQQQQLQKLPVHVSDKQQQHQEKQQLQKQKKKQQQQQLQQQQSTKVIKTITTTPPPNNVPQSQAKAKANFVNTSKSLEYKKE